MTGDTEVGACFLCAPDERLVYASEPEGIGLCGLGPLMPAYSVIATRAHIRSAADALVEVPSFMDFAEEVRARLARSYGSCLLTEHGRLPACVDVSGATDPHCYHAHFLAFPSSPAVDEPARTFFASVEEAGALREALTIARRHEEYFLLSPDANRFLVMTRPGRIMRQFARVLVAEAIGSPDLANWRKNPGLPDAIEGATALRAALGRSK
jgi:hypothetical protein